MGDNGDHDFQSVCNPFLSLWSEFSSMMLRAATAAPQMTPPEAVRQFRGSTFQALSKYFDEYLRSPQFLQSMKQSLDTAITVRKQMNDSLTKMHHAVQGTASEDVDQLMIAIRHLEQRMLDRIEALEARLDGVAARPERVNVAGRSRKTGTRSRRSVKSRKARPKSTGGEAGS